MLQPLSLQRNQFRIHAFGPEDLKRYDDLVLDIFNILSDERTLKYLPGKRLENIREAELFLRAIVLNYHSGRNYLHFITDNSDGRVIGMIDLISPELASEHYTFDRNPHFIEFYLAGDLTGCNIMTELLPEVIENLLAQEIIIGAVVHRENLAARRVLEKSSFSYQDRFDPVQDYYEVSCYEN
jgi:RimJ/RimL family protein N-acetyltransferase